MDVDDFCDMVGATIQAEDERMDEQMQMLSWQTSILINVSGNVKKRYKASDLYTPLAQQKEEAKKPVSKGGLVQLDKDEHEAKQQELMKRFGL